jgi:hypothetical protein
MAPPEKIKRIQLDLKLAVLPIHLETPYLIIKGLDAFRLQGYNTSNSRCE